MDTSTKSHTITTTDTALITHPAHIWLGSYQHTVPEVIAALQKIWCINHGCTHCAACINIKEHRHSSIRWLNPENQYTKEELESIFHCSSFMLENNDHFFFILQKADYFNQACANSLLKILEEPPTGYHFILLAQREEYIIPTIRSRCLIKIFPSEESSEFHEIASWFMSSQLPDPSTFINTIDHITIHNRETFEMLEKIFEYWLIKHVESLKKGNNTEIKKIKRILTMLQDIFEKPPMPGSSKIFWKNLFLQFIHL